MTDKELVTMIAVPRDLLVRADSYLSLLWHRPGTEHDVTLQMAVPRVIAELRKAYESAGGTGEETRKV